MITICSGFVFHTGTGWSVGGMFFMAPRADASIVSVGDFPILSQHNVRLLGQPIAEDVPMSSARDDQDSLPEEGATNLGYPACHNMIAFQPLLTIESEIGSHFLVPCLPLK